MFRCENTHNYLILLLTLGIISWLVVGKNVLADNIRPAYLDIEEFEPGAFRVVWKVPLNQNVPARFRPSFPESFKVSSPKKRVKMTTTDALVRIQLADGSLHRAVLRPTERSTTVPASEPTVSQREGGVRSVLKLADRWRYLSLFLAAWLLSLTPRARRRGIMLATVALIAGSLCGHALGRLPVYDKVFGPKMPSDMESKRILRGLMLNTYGLYAGQR
jgi:hypothetical protein